MNLDWIDLLPEEKQDKIRDEYLKSSKIEKINLLHNNHPEGLANIDPITSLDEFLKIIRVISTESTWYRGESKQNEFLIPKLYRNISQERLSITLSNERDYFVEFRRRSRHLVKNIGHNDYWSWYFLLQHYGGATRLLDWSKNPAVALFMALDIKKENSGNSIVYLLAPTVLSDYAFQEIKYDDSNNARILYPGEDQTDMWISNIIEKNNSIPNSPIALLPAYSDQRIISQHSCFTLFGNQINGFIKEEKPIVCPCCDRKIIHKIIIDGKSKEKLLKELKRIGISSAEIYPGLEGLVKDLNNEFL